MTEALNPYRQWLDLDTDAERLNHYELLGLALFEEDIDTIHRAADRALALVRSHRPGTHAARWAALLDELAQAKVCLSDSAEKSRYDSALRSQTTGNAAHGGPERFTAASEPEIAAVNQLPDLFPPGMEPSTPDAPKTTLHEAADGPRDTAPLTKPAVRAATTSPTVNPPQPGSAARTSASTTNATNSKTSSTSTTSPPTRPKPPPPPSSTDAGTGRLLYDPFEEGASNGAGISDPVPAAPVNAHVAPPHREQTSMLPMAVSVFAVVIVITLIVLFLAMRGTFGDSSSASPPPPQTAPAQTAPEQTMVLASPQVTPAVPNTSQSPAFPATANGGILGEQPATSTQTPPNNTVAGPLVQSGTISNTSPPDDTTADPAAPPMSTAAAEENGNPITVSAPVATRAELAELGQALKDVQLALGRHDFELAQLDLQKANALAVLPAHQSMIVRLRKLANHSQDFWKTVDTAVRGFRGVEELSVGAEGLVVLVVETSPDSVTVRKEGKNLRYSFTDMPPGLALAIAKTQLDASKPEHLLQLGACLATVADRKPAYLDQARKYWLQAQTAGADVDQLLLTLTDSYDLAQ